MYHASPRAATRPALADEARAAPAYPPGAFCFTPRSRSAAGTQPVQQCAYRSHGEPSPASDEQGRLAGGPYRSSEPTLAALPAPPAPPTVSASFLAGLRATAPLAISIVPLMTVYGVTARAAGLAAWFAQLLSVAVFAGSQLAAVQLLAAGAPGVVAGLTAALMNLRHVVYSATLAPQFKHLAWYWRMLAGYFVTDETYNTLVARMECESESHPHCFLLGGGAIIWVAAQSGTALGWWLGQSIPPGWSLDFTGTLVFLALLVLQLKHRAALVTAVTAGSLAVVLADLPWRLGLVVAIPVGLAVGLGFHRWQSPPSAPAQGGV